MSSLKSQPRQSGAVTKTQFQRPDGCPLPICSAISMYEDELHRHRETETKLRDSELRGKDLLRQKEELIAQKDVLRKESEHRLLNGLQLITSLLSLQSRTTKNAEVEAQLATAANRVATLGRIHRHLHSLDNAESVQFRQFLERLCDDLADMTSFERTERSIVVEGADLQIPTAIAIPLGFIACELITNSIKYAKGRIMVRLQTTLLGCDLSISDDGPGLPQRFNPAMTKGLGMKLVMALMKPIDGVLDIGRGDYGKGAKITVRFNLLDSAPTIQRNKLITVALDGD